MGYKHQGWAIAILVGLAGVGLVAPATAQITNSSDTSGSNVFNAPPGNFPGQSSTVTVSQSARQSLLQSIDSLVGGSPTASASLKSLDYAQADPGAVSEGTKAALLSLAQRFEPFNGEQWNPGAAGQDVRAATAGLSQDVAAAQQACNSGGGCERLNFLVPRVIAFLDSLELVQNELIQQSQRDRLF